MKKITNEIKIAVTGILAILIIYFGIIFLKGMSLFNNDDTYYVKMENVNGVQVGSPVLANGLNVGRVKNITFDNAAHSLVVELGIHHNFSLPEGSTVFISKELLGSAHINLQLGAADAKALNEGDTISGTPALDLMGEAAGMIPQIETLLPKLDSILASLNVIVSDPSIVATLHNLEYMTNNLRTTTDNINLMAGRDLPRLLNHADHMVMGLDSLSTSLARIDIEGIASNANQTLHNTNEMTAHLNHAMKSKDNTLGMLMNDNSIAVHLDTTILNASMLLQDLRQHPKRYVHFSLFGKKDK